MKDIEILLENRVGTLAKMGEILGKHKISLEGGGVFDNGAFSIAHFLVEEADRAKTELGKVGIEVVKIHDVIIQKLRQDVPGQLGSFCRELAHAKVNILTQYSDHSNQLIIVPDDYEKAKAVSEQWMKTWWSNEDYII
ncbi:amino acid-binding ACT domain-containing protein [Flagellimonas aequoris]|uniref:Amino acid-binding ACT domain-containing protein n=1 Tax=Flagellimonas aequoris TaxID=2306997 RepID=A0A418N671_9FLAO|nr:amino acid-binding ACT domain-containing protein [Allomuricauda aequoris]RIV69897.1 amino acid-binding ACT domain-containing protein [Allomuricauda aequoris]TXK01484.1 amino acid-binding ACT domain-containing protein [Allomuricauda aequoris]